MIKKFPKLSATSAKAPLTNPELGRPGGASDQAKSSPETPLVSKFDSETFPKLIDYG
jgi:hypothetical protein